MEQQKIGHRKEVKQVSKLDALRDTWIVMKPFVKFSIQAMKVIAHALIFIVKNIPKPDDHKSSKNDKIIKI